jgi:hypothetical protein
VRYKPASAIHCGKSLPSSTTVESQPQETASGRRSRSGGYVPDCLSLQAQCHTALHTLPADLGDRDVALRGRLVLPQFDPEVALLTSSHEQADEPHSGPVIRKPPLPSGWRPLSLPLPARSARMRDSSRVTCYRGYDRHRRNRFQIWPGRSALLWPGFSRGERLAAK